MWQWLCISLCSEALVVGVVFVVVVVVVAVVVVVNFEV